MPETLPVHF